MLPVSRTILWTLFIAGFHSQISNTVRSRPSQAIYVNEQCRYYQIPRFNIDSATSQPLYMNLTLDTITASQNFTTWDLQSYSLYNASCFQVSYNKSVTENYTSNVNDNNLNAPYALLLTFQLRGSPDTYSYVYPVVANLSSTPSDAIHAILNQTQTRSNRNGTIGYFDGPAQYVAIVREVQGFSSSGISQVSPCPSLTNYTGTNQTIYRFNCLLNEDPFYDHYQFLTVTHSFPFWLLVFAITFFIVFTNYLEEDIEMTDRVRTSMWMYYPIYTIYAAADYQIYPRRPRVSIVFLVCAAIFWFNSIVIFRYVDVMGQSVLHLAVRLVAIPFAAAIFGIIWEILAGLILAYYYKTNRDFVNLYTTNQDYEQKKHILEDFEERNFKATHIFYFLFLIFGLFFLITPINFLYYMSTDDQAWWLLASVIGIIWKYLFFDMILMLISRAACGQRLARIRGIEFDNETYMKWESIKKFI